jgi:hypothetical protein
MKHIIALFVVVVLVLAVVPVSAQTPAPVAKQTAELACPAPELLTAPGFSSELNGLAVKFYNTCQDMLVKQHELIAKAEEAKAKALSLSQFIERQDLDLSQILYAMDVFRTYRDATVEAYLHGAGFLHEAHTTNMRYFDDLIADRKAGKSRDPKLETLYGTWQDVLLKTDAGLQYDSIISALELTNKAIRKLDEKADAIFKEMKSPVIRQPSSSSSRN